MKRLAPLLLALLFCGCSGQERVTPSEFKKQYAEVGKTQSMHSVTYLGRRDGRAYINRSSMSTVSVRTIAKPRSDPFRHRLRSEANAALRGLNHNP